MSTRGVIAGGGRCCGRRGRSIGRARSIDIEFVRSDCRVGSASCVVVGRGHHELVLELTFDASNISSVALYLWGIGEMIIIIMEAIERDANTSCCR